MKLLLKPLLFCIALWPLLGGCGDLLVNDASSGRNVEEFEAAWKLADRFYPFFQFKNIDWDSLHAVYRPQAEAARGDEIYFVLYDLFSRLKDGHIEIRTEGGFPVATYLWPRYSDHRTFRPEVVRRYVSAPLRLAGRDRMAYGMLDAGIGYLHISTFKSGDWIQALDEILHRFRSTGGLILDVRNNNGGVSQTYDFVLSRFLTEPMRETIHFADGSSKSWTVRPAGPFPYSGRVALLINGASFSAAEIFADLMRRLPNVTLVGDTTGGGGGASEVFELPGGKRLKLPVKYFRQSDGSMIEWNGVAPDVLVEQTEADAAAGRDVQLEKAIEVLQRQDSQ